MNHSFNVELACKYGIEEAIIIENLAFWIKKNVANKSNFYENNYWTFNSSSAFNELFPYINRIKISRVLNKLEELKVLKSGNFNKLKFDRTKWYSIIDKSILQLYNIDCSNCNSPYFKMNNGIVQNETTIPDINSYINSNINKDRQTDSELKNNVVKFIQILQNQSIRFTPTECNKIIGMCEELKVNPMSSYNLSSYLRGETSLPLTKRMFLSINTYEKMKLGDYNDKQTIVKKTNVAPSKPLTKEEEELLRKYS